MILTIAYIKLLLLLALSSFFFGFLNGSEHVMSFKCALIISLVLGNIFLQYKDAEEYVRKSLLQVIILIYRTFHL